MRNDDQIRRPGYASDNAALGRRGKHTRDRIVDRAGQLFVTEGYHGTSIGAIAKAVGGSRATVYQYFQSKDEIFLELLQQCEPELLEHGRRLTGLGPDAQGLASLHRWLIDLADLYDRHAIVFLEFPGIGLKQGLAPARAGAVSDQYAATITATLRDAGVVGIDPADAAGALLRISHMVNLYRHRGMLGLGAVTTQTTSASLAIGMQLLLFPQTPQSTIQRFAPPMVDSAEWTFVSDSPELTGPLGAPDASAVSPTRQDLLSAASSLFAERGYYAVSMEEIAVAARVSQATAYRHFKAKVNILIELSAWSALEGRLVATELHELAGKAFDPEALRAWLSRYVRFHRSYGGVIRAWYDGTVAKQLPEDTVTQGLGAFHSSVSDFLGGVELPPGVHPAAATAIFLAVTGRLTELAVSEHPMDSDYDTAGLMMLVLQRALFGSNSC